MHGTKFNLHVAHKVDQTYVQGHTTEPADELVTITSTIASFLFSPAVATTRGNSNPSTIEERLRSRAGP